MLLLAFSPIGEEDSPDADNHFNFVWFVFGLLYRWWGQFVAISGDYFITNKMFVSVVGPLYHLLQSALQPFHEQLHPGFVCDGQHSLPIEAQPFLLDVCSLLASANIIARETRQPDKMKLYV